MSSSNETPHSSVESLSEISSELNNLLQIMSGTTAFIEDALAGNENAREYLSVLRSSISRAEKIAADLVKQAGGTEKIELMHPDFPAFVRTRNAKPTAQSGGSILVVDDEKMALTLMQRLLSQAGFDVLTAGSGFECLDLVRAQPLVYDLVLVDLTMPFMDGEETFRRLREIRPDIPVMLCTGFIQQERLSKLMSAGLVGFMRKPIAAAEIVSFVRATLANLRYSHDSFDVGSEPIAS